MPCIFRRNPALPKDGMTPELGCMSKGGIPIQPFYILGGFIPEGVMGLPENPDYHKSTAVVMSIIVNNWDMYSEDPMVQKNLRQAMVRKATSLAINQAGIL